MTIFSPRLERNAIHFPSGDQRGRLADGLAEGGLPGLLAVGRREPDLRAVLALVGLHHRLAHDVGGAPAVRRDLDVGDGRYLQRLERRPLAGIVRGQGGDSAGENRQDASRAERRTLTASPACGTT